MKIEYIRNMQFGYMRITLSKPLSKTEEEMLSNNIIEGILPVRWQKENELYLLRYDITRKQALDGLLENTLADEGLLKKLLIGVCVAVKQLEKYLLPQEGLLLLPETVFWDSKTETMHFCYYPESEEPLQERLTRLMEYILAKTDHKNVLAVQLAYGVYEEVQKPSFCLEDLPEYLKRISEKEKITEQEKAYTSETDEKIKSTYQYSENRGQITTGISMQKKKQKIVGKNDIMAWIKEKIKRYSRNGNRKQEPEEQMIFDSAWETVTEPETTVLHEPQNKIERILKYEGSNSLPDITIFKVPFVIGTASNCDGVVTHPNISRYHAKITCQEGTYFIEDLNSTNGTIVNGGLLSYKTRVSLKKGEYIYFANEPYRFW